MHANYKVSAKSIGRIEKKKQPAFSPGLGLCKVRTECGPAFTQDRGNECLEFNVEVTGYGWPREEKVLLSS